MMVIRILPWLVLAANCFAKDKMCQAMELGHASASIILQDYGVRGHTFPIQEESLLEVIQTRLQLAKKSGKLLQMQEQFKTKVAKKVNRPTPVAGIKRTTNPRVFYFNPTHVQQEDVRDHRGNIVVKAGTTVNPLTHLSWGRPLIFIDGDDVEQVNWATKQNGKIILVKGAPLELQDTHRIWFYFDQAGILTGKFGITQVPALVEQEGLNLKITEHRL